MSEIAPPLEVTLPPVVCHQEGGKTVMVKGVAVLQLPVGERLTVAEIFVLP